MIIDRINNWFTLSKQYFFTYRNGFFNLSYLSNSPELIVKSSAKMPFMKHNEERQVLYADTPFVKGEFYYVELEEGLWIMKSDMFYKNNVSYQPIYDKFLPSDYYFISINSIENELTNDTYEFNNVKIKNHSISFSKPATDFLNGHFKGATEIMYILYFNQEWAKKNILESTTTPDTVKQLLNDTQKEFLNYSYDKKAFKDLIAQLSTAFNHKEKPNVFELKKLTYTYFSVFFDSLEREDNVNSNQLSYGDRIKIGKIEHYLSQNLFQKFPGIDNLAKDHKISPTRLKENFKIMYGSSIFKHFQANKMQLAEQYVKNTDLKIKDIAAKFGYENVSKFSQTFQKCQGILPSEYRK